LPRIARDPGDLAARADGLYGAWLAGTVLGAGLGMLFAPKAGSELRSQLSEQAGNLASQAQDGVRKVTENAGEWADRGREMYGKAREAVARGADVRIIADLGSDPPGYGFVQMLVRADLVKTGRYKTFKDVKGMTVAANAPGSPGLPPIAKFPARAGLRLDDVKLIYLPYPQRGIALKNGSVDVTQTLALDRTELIRLFGEPVRLRSETLTFGLAERAGRHPQIGAALGAVPFLRSHLLGLWHASSRDD